MEKSQIKLLIAVPTLDYIHFRFVESLVGLMRQLDKEQINYDICIRGGTLVYLARDFLAAKAVNEDYTHVLWLDADMVFDSDIFDLLYETDKHFVSGIYYSRHKNRNSVMFKTLDPDVRYDIYPDEVFPIEGCGFGICLIRTNLITAVLHKYGNCFKPIPQYGEDLTFCYRLKQYGFDMWANPSVKAGHIAQTIVWPDTGDEPV